MEWTVHELAERAGISGRTLRHYHQIGLLEPDRVGSNGYRYYGPDAVSRLQRILLLRETGMPLAGIAGVLDAPTTPEVEVQALTGHLEHLARERDSLNRRIESVVARKIGPATKGMESQSRRPTHPVACDPAGRA